MRVSWRWRWRFSGSSERRSARAAEILARSSAAAAFVQVGLAAQVAVIRLLGQRPAQPCGNFTPQLGGSGIRIGDDEEVIDVRALPADFTQEPVDEHLGFAGTGGGGDQKRPAFVFNDCLLMGGQCDRHRGASFPVRSRIAPA